MCRFKCYALRWAFNLNNSPKFFTIVGVRINCNRED